MKPGFLSLELVFSIIILGIIFTFGLKMLNNKSKPLENKTLYTLESELLKGKVKLSDLKKSITKGVLKSADFKQGCLEKMQIKLCILRPPNSDYKAFFK